MEKAGFWKSIGKLFGLGFIVFVLMVMMGGDGFCKEKREEYHTSLRVKHRPYYFSPGSKTMDAYACNNTIIQMNLYIYADKKKPVKNTPFRLTLYPLSIDKVIDISLKRNVENLRKDSTLSSLKTVEETVDFYTYEKNYPGYSSHKLVKTDVGKVEPGFYYLVAQLGKSKLSTIIHISRMGLIVKSSGNEAIVFAQDKNSSVPIPGVNISIRIGNEFVNIGKTDDKGILKFQKSQLPQVSKKDLNPEKLLIKAVKNDDFALCEMGFEVHSSDFIGYIYTDRPIYRPGQTVHFKGILRGRKGIELKPLVNEEVEVLVYKPFHLEIFKKKLKTNEFGSISDSFKLDEMVPLGQYDVCFKYKNEREYGYFFIEEYRKPEYNITVKPLKKFLLKGEKAKFQVDTSYYFGEPLPNTDFTYEISEHNTDDDRFKAIEFGIRYYFCEFKEIAGYKKNVIKPEKYEYVNIKKEWSGKTDKNGRAIIEIDTQKIGSFKHTVKVQIQDKSRRPVIGTGSVITTGSRYKIDIKTNKRYYLPRDPVKISVKAIDYDGKPVSAKVYLEIVESVDINKNDDSKSNKKEILFTKVFETDNKGEYNLSCSPRNKSGHFIMFASSKDKKNNIIISKSGFTIAGNKHTDSDPSVSI